MLKSKQEGVLMSGITNDSKNYLKRNYKDIVFSGLFEDPRYQLALVRALHPEDTTVTEDDISLITLSRVITNGIHNDLGLLVRNKLIILAEAQSTWSDNIVLRSLFYIANTYQDYIKSSKQNVFSNGRIEIPMAELYVIYTGNRKNVPELLSLSETYFEGMQNSIEVRVNVISPDSYEHRNDIIGEYIRFTEISDEQRKLYNYNPESIDESFRICIEEGVLREYLIRNYEEVRRDMMYILTQEYADEAAEWERERNERERERIERENEKLKLENESAKGLIEKLISSGKITAEDVAELEAM